MRGMNLAAAGSTVSTVLKELAKDNGSAASTSLNTTSGEKQGLVAESSLSSSKGLTPYNASVFSKGKTAASFTSTSLTPATKTEVEIIDEVPPKYFPHLKKDNLFGRY